MNEDVVMSIGAIYFFVTFLWAAWQNIEMEKNIDGEYFISTLFWPVTLLLLSPVLLIKALKALGLGSKEGAHGIPKYFHNIKNTYKQEIKR